MAPCLPGGFKVWAACASAVAAFYAYKLAKKMRSCEDLPNSERHGGEHVAEVLKRNGVTTIFMLPGGHVSPVIVACERIGIRIIDTRNEADAVFAADAMSRMKQGEIGVAVVTAGPGVTNTVTAMKNAQMAHSPLLLIGGAAATVTRGRGSLQDVEQVGLFASITKFTISPSRVQDIPSAVQKAITVAQSGTPGPVFVELPIDILYPILELKANMGVVKRKIKHQLTDADIKNVVVPAEQKAVAGTTPETYVARLDSADAVFLKGPKLPLLINCVTNYSLHRIFDAAWTTPLPHVPHVACPKASQAQLAALQRLLSGAKNLVVIVSSQIIVNGDICRNDIATWLQGLQAPTFLSGMARGMMGHSSSFFFRQVRRDALKNADVVLLLGTLVDFRLDYGRSFSRKSKIISVNRCSTELKRNTDVFWKPALAVLADPAEVLGEIHKAKSSPSAVVAPNLNKEWVATLRAKEDEKEAANAKAAQAPAFGKGKNELINPLRFFSEMNNVLKDRDDIIYVGDGGDFVATAAYSVRPNGPCTWLDPGPYGTLGVGAGFALAAKIAEPKKHVFLVFGDGSAGYSIAEFDTFRRHKCPVIAVIGNDACWTQIVRDQKVILGSEAACNLSYCRYDKIAMAYGQSDVSGGVKKKGGEQQEQEEEEEGHVLGLTISSPDQIVPALQAALAASEQGRSVCINVLIGSSKFREGSLSV